MIVQDNRENNNQAIVHDDESYKCPSCNVYMKWDEVSQDYECPICRKLLCEFEGATIKIIHG